MLFDRQSQLVKVKRYKVALHYTVYVQRMFWFRRVARIWKGFMGERSKAFPFPLEKNGFPRYPDVKWCNMCASKINKIYSDHVFFAIFSSLGYGGFKPLSHHGYSPVLITYDMALFVHQETSLIAKSKRPATGQGKCSLPALLDIETLYFSCKMMLSLN